MRPRRLHLRERGEAYVLLLVLLLLATMFSATLLAASSVGVTSEARRYGQQRAGLNALSGLVLAEAQLKRDLPGLFKRLAADANASRGATDERLPYLAGVTFDPVEMHFAMPGSDAGPEDTADVHVEITLPAPPEAVSLAGLPVAAGEVQRSEKYTFKVSLTSTGRAIYESKAVARRTSKAFVGLVIGGRLDAGVRGTLAGGNIIEIGAAGTHFYDQPRETGGWDLVPPAYADGGIGSGSVHQGVVSNYTLSQGGNPTGGWSGEPLLLGYATPMKAGFASGNAVYYWYAKGLPPGSVGDPSGGAPAVAGSRGIVMATDDWRFSSSYRASDDTISVQGPDGRITRGQGSPLYGVIAIQAPSPYDAAKLPDPLPALDAWFSIPGVGYRRYVVTDNVWWPETALPVHDLTQYTTIGYPENPSERGSTPEAQIVRPAPPPGVSIAVDSETNVQTSNTTIAVPGNPGSGGQMMGTGGIPSPGSGQVGVAIVSGRSARIGMRWGGAWAGVAGATTNSLHGLVLGEPVTIGGGGDIPIDPPPPGGTPTTELIAFLYWPGSTWWLPERIEPNGGK